MSAGTTQETPSRVDGSPLRSPTFRNFYVGLVGAALGYTMQATTASWLMATLTPSALMVALVQTASTGPSLIFGLVAGSLADIADRRTVILAAQLVMLTAVTLLGVAALLGMAGPALVLLLTLIVGCGFTFYNPAQQASVNELVSRQQIPQAVALSAIAYNAARAAGPALAGAIAAGMNAGSALLTSAIFFSVMIVALRRWKRRERPPPGVPERLLAGVRSGLRYARHSPVMRAVILRVICFSLCASAFWALLPVIARDLLGLGAAGFGVLSAGFGAGAIVGAWSIPYQLKRRPLERIVTMAVLLWSVGIGLMAVAEITAVAVLGACGAGAAWVCVLASLSAATQSTAPAWVRARAVSMNLVSTQAGLAIGSPLWGALAGAAGIRVALVTSVGLVLILYFLIRRSRVEMGTEADVTPRVQLPDLAVPIQPLPDDGPVLIQREYTVDAPDRRAFLLAIRSVEPIRRRSGALSWRVFRDLEAEDRFVERYLIASWSDYLRSRARITIADTDLLDRVARFQRAGVPIRVSRLIGLEADAYA